MRQLCKGNVAIVKAAILAGCRSFYGYPITPASEIAESAALYIPQVGGTFLQAESEVAAINMVYGAAASGARVMTASSGPGVSLMQEGMSYIAGAELPCVIVDVVRGGPGLGNIAPEQSDYFAMVKGGGHGYYRNIVLAPASVQEMVDLTVLAFELADKYRNPAVILTDGFVGQMMEPLELEYREVVAPHKAVGGERHSRDAQESDQFDLPRARRSGSITSATSKRSTRSRRKDEPRWELYEADDAEILLVGYGIISRILRSAVQAARAEGQRVGLFRPITLWPFPSEALRSAAANVREVMAVELSNGQMVEDVRLALNGRVPVEFYGRIGGNVPSVEEIHADILRRLTTLVERETLAHTSR